MLKIEQIKARSVFRPVRRRPRIALANVIECPGPQVVITCFSEPGQWMVSSSIFQPGRARSGSAGRSSKDSFELPSPAARWSARRSSRPTGHRSHFGSPLFLRSQSTTSSRPRRGVEGDLSSSAVVVYDEVDQAVTIRSPVARPRLTCISFSITRGIAYIPEFSITDVEK